jgi:hypothetical protein
MSQAMSQDMSMSERRPTPLPAERRAAPKPAGIPLGDRPMYASDEGQTC